MTRETTLLRADTGAPISFGMLIDGDMRDVPVWSLDDEGRMVAAPLTKAFPSGHKHAYRLQLASGRTVEASGNHKFRTLNEWRRLDELGVGDRLAVPRRVPDPLEVGLGWSEHRMALLAYLIADGTVLARQPVHITDDDPVVLETARAAAAAEFGITARILEKGQDASGCASIYLPAPFRAARGRQNPINAWFRELGIFDLRSKQKRLPDALYRASRTEITWFLRHYLSTDGNVTPKRPGGVAKIRFDTSSRQIADGIVQLLGRLGIVARLRTNRTWFAVAIENAADMRWFAANVGAVGVAGQRLAELAQGLPATSNTNVDTLPLSVWGRVKEARRAAGMTERQLQAGIGMSYCGSAIYKSCPSRERLTRIATVLGSSELRALADTDIFWDRIVSIEPLGLREVFDATVKGTHNFIANGIVAHNSLEQDADLVILINRPDAWERDDPRAGEADLILAKHRNGPTATITVAHQLHYARFADIARGVG